MDEAAPRSRSASRSRAASVGKADDARRHAGRLVQNEERQTGAVTKRVYGKYVRNGGWWMACIAAVT
ncbi:MAG: hypothetical protein ACK4ZJ_19050, partial [Allorhizobium sp.]